MTTASEPRRLRADAVRNRQALIDAAQRLFAARGLSVTLDDITAEAGVNVSTPGARGHVAGVTSDSAASVSASIVASGAASGAGRS
jgi:hypothetical protein